jgi:hypothetical protein
VRAAKRQTNVDLLVPQPNPGCAPNGPGCRQRLTRHHHPATGNPHAGAADHDDNAVSDDGAGGTGGGHVDAAADHPDAAGDGRVAAGGSCVWCGSAPSTARPAFLVVADLAALDPDTPVGSGTARLHWATNRAAPVELTAAAARRLACDATLRAVVTDGADILGVTAAPPQSLRDAARRVDRA